MRYFEVLTTGVQRPLQPFMEVNRWLFFPHRTSL